MPSSEIERGFAQRSFMIRKEEIGRSENQQQGGLMRNRNGEKHARVFDF
jgi:hypothetical protein